MTGVIDKRQSVTDTLIFVRIKEILAVRNLFTFKNKLHPPSANTDSKWGHAPLPERACLELVEGRGRGRSNLRTQSKTHLHRATFNLHHTRLRNIPLLRSSQSVIPLHNAVKLILPIIRAQHRGNRFVSTIGQ